MNEFLRNFIMTGIRDMISHNKPRYQVYQYASGWYDKGVLTEDDLKEIEASYTEAEVTETVEAE